MPDQQQLKMHEVKELRFVVDELYIHGDSLDEVIAKLQKAKEEHGSKWKKLEFYFPDRPDYDYGEIDWAEVVGVRDATPEEMEAEERKIEEDAEFREFQRLQNKFKDRKAR